MTYYLAIDAEQDTWDALVESGETMELRRAGVAVTVRGRLIQYRPQEIGGGVIQGDRKLIVSNREMAEAAWPTPPKLGDQVLFRNAKIATVQGCETLVVDGVVVRHNLQIRGGA